MAYCVFLTIKDIALMLYICITPVLENLRGCPILPLVTDMMGCCRIWLSVQD